MSKLPSYDAVTISKTEPSVCFDVRLGGEWEFIDVNTEAASAMMRELRMNDEAIGNRLIEVSAGAPNDEQTRCFGRYKDGRITTYLGSAKELILEYRKNATYPGFIGLRASLRSSRNLAHEIVHCAEIKTMPLDALYRERRQYDRRLCFPNLSLRLGALLALGSVVAAAEYITYRPNLAVAGGAGLLAIATSLWPAKRNLDRANERTLNSYRAYFFRPMEIRAREYSDAYAHMVLEDTAPFLVTAILRSETNELLAKLTQTGYDTSCATFNACHPKTDMS